MFTTLLIFIAISGVLLMLLLKTRDALAAKTALASDAAARLVQADTHQQQLVQAHLEELAQVNQKFAGIVNLEAEIQRQQQKLQNDKADAEKALAKAQAELDGVFQRASELEEDYTERRAGLEKQYQEALAKYEELKNDVSLFEVNLEDISSGVYEPRFTFKDSAEYKTALENLREQARNLARASFQTDTSDGSHDTSIKGSGRAIGTTLSWSIGGNRREGARLTKLVSKSLLRSFNGECEAVLADVAWNNISKMEERVRKAYKQINDLGDGLKITITPEYLELKLNEVRLTYEFEQKKYDEREELRATRESLRDEQKAAEEIEEAQEAAESAEALYQRLLEQARKEAAVATGAQLKDLTDKVATFEAKLDEARKKKDKAIARAQLTKSGFVYVISNIGAFGKGIFKIGLTRRLEPLDRIAELSSASVPFPFDVHAMMFSLDAPALETALHKHFQERKLNLSNLRKEFFHKVELSEIETVVRQKGLSAQFIEFPEAREWRETLVKRQEREQQPKDSKFSEALF